MRDHSATDACFALLLALPLLLCAWCVPHVQYLEWATQNNIVVLFPQATATLSNPEGCFDWWGFSSSSFALQSGVQPAAVMGMLKTLSGSA